MAIKPFERYPGKANAPTADYPLGSARNITNPSDGTGTPWEKDLVNDIWGFFQNLLDEASLTASGSPDKVGVSQYTQAINALIQLSLLANNPAEFATAIVNGFLGVDSLTVNNNATINGNLTTNLGTFTAANFGQGQDLDHYESGVFTPTFNAAPSATVRNGRYIRIGDKVDAFIYLSGTAAQRLALPGATKLEIGNVPYLENVVSYGNGFVSVVEEKGVYFYENFGESRSGFLDAPNQVLNLWTQNEFLREIKTVATWAAGDFDFYIHASFIVG